MKMVKFVLCLAILIASTKKGCSADAVWKPLTDLVDNADADGADGVHVKAVTLQPNAEAFLTKRRTKGKRLGYDVRSPKLCVEKKEVVTYNGQLYTNYVCKTHNPLCANYQNPGGKCTATISVIGDVSLSVCKCMGR